MDNATLDLQAAEILIVDDVPDNVRLLSTTLSDEGYKVRGVTSGSMALMAIRSAAPDLVLLDINMPEMDGYEVCRQLKADEQTRRIPVVFLSALDEVLDKVKAFGVGGVDYITKPFQVDEVLARVATQLERYLLLRDLEKLVDKRTHELQLKVRELEGKDRINAHLLTYHPLEDTLDLVLEVIDQVMDLDRAVIYMLAEGALKPVAAMSAPGERVPRETLDQLDPSPELRQAFTDLAQNGERRPVATPEGTAVPIVRGDELLSCMVVDKDDHQPDAQELRTLSSFALQAAVAINDALVQQDSGEWSAQLTDALKVDDGIDTDDLHDQAEATQ